jgi:hypothetical protein
MREMESPFIDIGKSILRKSYLGEKVGGQSGYACYMPSGVRVQIARFVNPEFGGDIRVG